MEWNSGFSALYELKRVDPVSFMDAGSFDFTAGTIDWTDTGLMESADLTMTENPGECWVRVYLKAKQESNGDRVALFTGLTSVPERKLDGTRESFNVECYSVLKPVADVLVSVGYYAPSGADAAQLVSSLLSIGPAPVVVDDEGPCLTEPIVAEDDMSRLDVAWLILDAIGWRLRIDGNGTIHVCPAASEVSAVFDVLENDIVELSITDSQDWFSVPNCIRVTSGANYAEYRDEDPDSMVSVIARRANRGGSGEIWMSDTASALGDNESLSEYSLRVLREAQTPARSVSYTRRYRPDVLATDLVALHLPGAGIDGTFRITSQSMELKYGGKISEEVVMIG